MAKNDITLNIQGLDELKRALSDFPPKFQAAVLRGGVRAAAVVIRDDARSRVPVLQEEDARRVRGLLRRSVRVMSTRVRGDKVEGGVAAGVSKKDGRAFYAHMVERGTKKMAARPFMRPAADGKAAAAWEALREYCARRITDALVQRGGVYADVLGGDGDKGEK